jgi:muramoyltetrapeptide carboxypeptidase LdcA involved in peptidoglycan recycling
MWNPLKDSLLMTVATRGYDLSILAGADFAHTDPLFIIPIDGRAVLDTKEPYLRFIGPFVR